MRGVKKSTVNCTMKSFLVRTSTPCPQNVLLTLRCAQLSMLGWKSRVPPGNRSPQRSPHSQQMMVGGVRDLSLHIACACVSYVVLSFPIYLDSCGKCQRQGKGVELLLCGGLGQAFSPLAVAWLHLGHCVPALCVPAGSPTCCLRERAADGTVHTFWRAGRLSFRWQVRGVLFHMAQARVPPTHLVRPSPVPVPGMGGLHPWLHQRQRPFCVYERLLPLRVRALTTCSRPLHLESCVELELTCSFTLISWLTCPDGWGA